MRGKGSAPPRGHPLPGITPAYAGKSNALLNLPAGQRDHPRVCGEKEAAALSEVYETGSPPRMRGKAPLPNVRLAALGITPAYAGKRCAKRLPPCQYGDHPRVCGEKCMWGCHVSALTGSPPRMRGKVSRLSQLMAETGITPAYAGKSKKNSVVVWPFWDHPRVCGEKTQISTPTGINTGSPPRMRGKD